METAPPGFRRSRAGVVAALALRWHLADEIIVETGHRLRAGDHARVIRAADHFIGVVAGPAKTAERVDRLIVDGGVVPPSGCGGSARVLAVGFTLLAESVGIEDVQLRADLVPGTPPTCRAVTATRIGVRPTAQR